MLTLASALIAPSTVTGHQAEPRAIPDAGASQLRARAGSRANDVFSVAVGTSQNADINALSRAGGNARAGASLLQAAGRGLDAIGEILKQMKALATTASKAPPSINEGAIANAEFERLRSEIDRIADETVFDGTKVLKGLDFALQVGTGAAAADDVAIKLRAATVAGLEPDLADDDVRSVASATQALTDVTNAIAVLDDIRAQVRAAAVRVGSAQQNLALGEGVLNGRNAALLDRPATLDSAESLAALIREEFLTRATPAISGGLAGALRGLLLSAHLQPLQGPQPSERAAEPSTAAGEGRTEASAEPARDAARSDTPSGPPRESAGTAP